MPWCLCLPALLSTLAFGAMAANPLLFVCEEAHKYAPADTAVGFIPTRRALSRIAKEGRKYGVYLGLVTQRPAELDPTIISQCGTLFAMRMSNDRDQAFLRAAVCRHYGQSPGLRAVARHARGACLWRRHSVADPADIFRASRGSKFRGAKRFAKSSRRARRWRRHELHCLRSSNAGGRWASSPNMAKIRRDGRTGASARAREPRAPQRQARRPRAASALLTRPAAEQPDPYARLQRPASAPPGR